MTGHRQKQTLWSTQRGFTIVELLIVIIVIAILAAIVIVAYNGITARANASAAQSAASDLAKLLANSYITNSSYPNNLSTINNGGPMPNTGGTTYAYHPGSGNSSYCTTVTTGASSYKITDTATTPTSGGCPGDGVGGVAAITNLIANPSFEGGLGGWGNGPNATTATSTASPNTGATSLTFTHNSGAVAGNAYLSYNISGLTVGQQYTISYYAKSLSGSPSIGPSIQDNAIGGARPAGSNPPWITPGTSWTRYSITWTADAANVYLILDYTGSGAGESTAVDSVMLTQGSTLYTYADGSSPNWLWNGSANSSTSTGPPQ